MEPRHGFCRFWLPLLASELYFGPFGEARNPSNGFYERMGAERTYGENGDFHGGYGWRDRHSLIAAE